jgi:hypothetical protein
MGIFFEQVEFINRDTKQRQITFDGQRVYLEPNYNEAGEFLEDVHNFAPKLCIPYALNQNVVMGSEDPIDPSGFDSYVVPKVKRRKKGKVTDEWRYDFSFLPSKRNMAITRVDLTTYLDDPSLKVMNGRGTFKASEAALMAGRTGIATQSINEDE